MPASGGVALLDPPQNLVDKPCIVHHCMHYDYYPGLYFSVEKRRIPVINHWKNKRKTEMDNFYMGKSTGSKFFLTSNYHLIQENS